VTDAISQPSASCRTVRYCASSPPQHSFIEGEGAAVKGKIKELVIVENRARCALSQEHLNRWIVEGNKV